MKTAIDKCHYYFNLAFELAYFIHVNKDVAFFVAEDALDELPLMLGNQEKNRKPAERLRGFWKWGERTRPLRKTVRLSESQMLQWLVYKQSESWERQSESGTGLYLPTEEDMIVRYIEHLVFITLRRGSFYVTLAIAQLLHQFDRRETRLLYDVLTQGDSARMKDTSYIGKQRLELLSKVCERFDHMVNTIKIPGGEKQLVMLRPIQSVNKLALESLRRFTPCDTECVVKPGFDPTDIPPLYFQEGSVDEDPIEVDRIHTLLDPVCFARFVEGLCKLTRQLPDDSPDKLCNYDSLSDRLTVPQFSNFPEGPSRGDRFEPQQLIEADYVRLERTLSARAARRRSFAPERLSVYVDNVLTQSFDYKRSNRVQFLIGADVGVIEVRGRDDQGVLTLAILLVEFDVLRVKGAFKDSIVGQGGRKLQIQLTPIRESDREIRSVLVEVRYTDSRLRRFVLGSVHQVLAGFSRLLGSNSELSVRPNPKYPILLKACAVSALVIAGVLLVWLALLRSSPGIRPSEQAEKPSSEEEKIDTAVPAPKMPERRQSSNQVALVARASWSTDPHDSLRAIETEPTRGEAKTIDLSRHQQNVLLSLPLYDDTGSDYSRYRVTLAAAAKPVWKQTLAAPRVSLTGSAHILNLVLVGGRLSKQNQYDLKIEGRTQSGWHAIGHLSLSPTER